VLVSNDIIQQSLNLLKSHQLLLIKRVTFYYEIRNNFLTDDSQSFNFFCIFLRFERTGLVQAVCYLVRVLGTLVPVPGTSRKLSGYYVLGLAAPKKISLLQSEYSWMRLLSIKMIYHQRQLSR
jgi:hypothetical protein